MTSSLRPSCGSILNRKSFIASHSVKEASLDFQESFLSNTRVRFTRNNFGRHDLESSRHPSFDMNQTDTVTRVNNVRSNRPLSHHSFRNTATGALFTNDVDDEYFLDTIVDRSRSDHADVLCSDTMLSTGQQVARTRSRLSSTSSRVTYKPDQLSSFINYVSGPGLDQSNQTNFSNPQVLFVFTFSNDLFIYMFFGLNLSICRHVIEHFEFG